MTERIYDPAQIEPKWQKWWDENGTNKIDAHAAKNPFYVLMMFPYPSAEGLHVGNVFAFTGADIQGRYRRLRGHDVFEPIGFDAFGMHSEMFAQRIGKHPADIVPNSIRNFTRQLTMMGFMFDWRHQVDTTSPEYYKWTQWVFLQLYKAGFVYRDVKEVNYAPSIGSVISDEQVMPDGTFERDGTPVERRKLPSWFFRITSFADRLVDNLEWLDWSETTRTAQRNWIGRSTGAEIDFEVEGAKECITVFTTRPDTLFGATFMVLSPEHPLVDAITTETQKSLVAEYRQSVKEQPPQSDTGILPVTPESLQSNMGILPMTLESLADQILSEPVQGTLKIRQGAYLPHWKEDGRIYHVIFRLGDSLPQTAMRSIVEEARIQAQIEGLDAEAIELREKIIRASLAEKYLDDGLGECILRDKRAAGIVKDVLEHFEGERYRLAAWCIMPNHVHVVVQPIQGHELSDILHSWKSYTSNEINKVLGRTGGVWQAEYYDHIIRGDGAFGRVVEYVWRNPEKARLKDWAWRWRLDAAGLGQDAQVTLKAKTGVFTGAHAINPANGEKLPIYIADYVLMGYGTGAIMAVPSGDHRDFEFAKKFGLEVPCIIDPDMEAFQPDMVSGMDADTPSADIRDAVLAGNAAWSGPGRIVNSSNAEVKLDGLAKAEAIETMIAWLEKKSIGRRKHQFRLRDWGISRQRYWGPPVPIIYDEDGNAHPVPEDQLPVLLPPMSDLSSPGDGRGPLAKDENWINVEIAGKKYRRETDVMDNFLDSAWYFLRYPSARDDQRAWDPELIRKWLPVDIYIGGNEHAVLHLLYTRFLCLALTEAGVLDMSAKSKMSDPAEPFAKFRAHGLLIKDGAKMSKSKGNIINPDEFVAAHGTDTLRAYLMFLGPYTHGGDFRDKDIQGIRRFFNRVFAYYFEETRRNADEGELPNELRVKLHQTIRKVGDDIENLSYNTAIAALMELLNAMKAADSSSATLREALCIMLAPFAPHLAEEIWQVGLKKKGSVFTAHWPRFDPALTVLDEIEIVVQINGKVRDRVTVAREASKEELEAAALATDAVTKQTANGSAVKKIIVVPGRLVNVIVG